MIRPSSFAVLALKALQKSMMAMPCGPSAVPTGGAGVALPAGIWILTIAATLFFAIVLFCLSIDVAADRSEFGDLAEVHLDEGLAAEDVDEHLELHVIGVDLGDRAQEVGERALLDADALAFLEVELRLGAGGLLGADPALDGQEVADVAATERGGLLAAVALADEPGDAGGVADAVPRLVGHVATHQDVSGEHLALHVLLLAVLELDDLFHGDHDLEDLIFHVHRLDAGVEVGGDLLLVARLRVHDIPGSGAGPGVVLGLLGRWRLADTERVLLGDDLDVVGRHIRRELAGR